MGCASAQTQSQDRVTGAARSMPDLGNELLQLHAVLRTVWRVALHLAAHRSSRGRNVLLMPGTD
jgi:hypothetical protein